jgi:hypothetical protein
MIKNKAGAAWAAPAAYSHSIARKALFLNSGLGIDLDHSAPCRSSPRNRQATAKKFNMRWEQGENGTATVRF